MMWQAETLLRTSVMVTPCGSLAALSYLLPPGATAVVMNYLQSETKANVQLDDDAFWNVDHVTLAYYPVGPEDYEGTTVCTFLASSLNGWSEALAYHGNHQVKAKHLSCLRASQVFLMLLYNGNLFALLYAVLHGNCRQKREWQQCACRIVRRVRSRRGTPCLRRRERW